MLRKVSICEYLCYLHYIHYMLYAHQIRYIHHLCRQIFDELVLLQSFCSMNYLLLFMLLHKQVFAICLGNYPQWPYPLRASRGHAHRANEGHYLYIYIYILWYIIYYVFKITTIVCLRLLMIVTILITMFVIIIFI